MTDATGHHDVRRMPNSPSLPDLRHFQVLRYKIEGEGTEVLDIYAHGLELAESGAMTFTEFSLVVIQGGEEKLVGQYVRIIPQGGFLDCWEVRPSALVN